MGSIAWEGGTYDVGLGVVGMLEWGLQKADGVLEVGIP